jgi:calreticulin
MESSVFCQKIKNPNYQGKWKAPMIDNPGMFPWNEICLSATVQLVKCECWFLCFSDFKDDPYIYAFDSLKYIGIELWQVGFG